MKTYKKCYSSDDIKNYFKNPVEYQTLEEMINANVNWRCQNDKNSRKNNG